MFSPDVIALKQFYDTPLGERARGLIAESIRRLWPDVSGDTLLGIGYPLPFMERYMDQAAPALVCMPAGQGAIYWPPTRANRVFMAHEAELPLQENSINRILLVHSVEHSEQLSWMMQDISRVLAPGGRVLAVVPNRMGAWSRSSRSPFGHGRPFSMAQLRDLFEEHQLTITRSGSALFMPPTRLNFLWKCAHNLESVGKLCFRFIGGVLLIEAQKQIFADMRQPVVEKKRYRVPLGATKPVLSR